MQLFGNTAQTVTLGSHVVRVAYFNVRMACALFKCIEIAYATRIVCVAFRPAWNSGETEMEECGMQYIS